MNYTATAAIRMGQIKSDCYEVAVLRRPVLFVLYPMTVLYIGGGAAINSVMAIT